MQLVESVLGTAPLETHPLPHWCLQMLVLHNRERRENLTRLFLNHLTQESPDKIVRLFWESDQAMESSGEPTTPGAAFGEGAYHSSSREQALAAHRRGGPEGPGANASVCRGVDPRS